MLFRIFIFAMLSAGVWWADAYYHSKVLPRQASALAVAAVNGNDQDAAKLRFNDTAKGAVLALPWILTAGAFALCFGGVFVRSLRKVSDHG